MGLAPDALEREHGVFAAKVNVPILEFGCHAFHVSDVPEADVRHVCVLHTQAQNLQQATMTKGGLICCITPMPRGT